MGEVNTLLISYIRSTLLYLLLIISVRLMGKRQIGEMEPSEFVMAMLLANLAAIPMQDPALPLLSGLTPLLTVLALELILSWLSLRSIRFRKLLCGRPIILIENGTICQVNLGRTRITIDELTEHLRENGIMDLSTVQYAILETNGQISTFLYGKDRPATAKEAGIKAKNESLPYTIVSDGKVLSENLQLSGRDHNWLNKELRKVNCDVADIFLLTVDQTGNVYLCRKETAQ